MIRHQEIVVMRVLKFGQSERDHISEVNSSGRRVTADVFQIHLQTAAKAMADFWERHGVSVNFDRELSQSGR